MADSSAANTRKRLSVWAATEPLPTPLPPPPRIPRNDTPDAPPVDLRATNQLPEDSSQSNPVATPQPREAVPPIREDRIPLPRILASLAIAGVLLAIVGWLQMHQPQELDWPTLKSIALGQAIEPLIPESELPYITVVPLVPNGSRTEFVERDRESNRPAQQVTMSDIKPFEPPDSDPATETQRR